MIHPFAPFKSDLRPRLVHRTRRVLSGWAMTALFSDKLALDRPCFRDMPHHSLARRTTARTATDQPPPPAYTRLGVARFTEVLMSGITSGTGSSAASTPPRSSSS